MFLVNRQPDSACYFYAFERMEYEILIKLFSASVIFLCEGRLLFACVLVKTTKKLKNCIFDQNMTSFQTIHPNMKVKM